MSAMHYICFANELSSIKLHVKRGNKFSSINYH